MCGEREKVKKRGDMRERHEGKGYMMGEEGEEKRGVEEKGSMRGKEHVREDLWGVLVNL